MFLGSVDPWFELLEADLVDRPLQGFGWWSLVARFLRLRWKMIFHHSTRDDRFRYPALRCASGRYPISASTATCMSVKCGGDFDPATCAPRVEFSVRMWRPCDTCSSLVRTLTRDTFTKHAWLEMALTGLG